MVSFLKKYKTHRLGVDTSPTSGYKANMETVKWGEQFSVHIKEIDDQHKKFVGLLRMAYTKMDKSVKPGELDFLLDALIEHAKLHFATEEKYFWHFDYEYANMHVKLHDDIKKELANFKDRHVKDGSKGLVMELIDFLEEWLLVHILKHDKEYLKDLHENAPNIKTAQ